MFTINQLAKKHDVSRSTLLYYDKIGLLKPTARSEANYRLYSSQDAERMNKIVLYREAGLSLDDIAELLEGNINQSANILEQRLAKVNDEISDLRKQQQIIVGLLGKDSLFRQAKTMNKTQWVNILKASGMDDAAMHRWHIEFERDLPQMHTDFLESLGCSSEEVKQIKAWSKSQQ